MSTTTEFSVGVSGVVTPEAVVLDFDTGGAGSRILAEVLDVLAQLVVLYLVMIAVGVVAIGGGDTGGTAAIIIGTVLVFVLLVGYPIAFETLWNGRTPGKAALGLRVITIEGGPIRFRHAAIRGMFGIVEIWVTLGSLAMLSIVGSRRNQRIGDLVAGTAVLRERSAVANSAEAVSMSFPPLAGFENYVRTLDISLLTTEQYGLIRSFLLRVNTLTPAARASLATSLADSVATRLGQAPPAGMQAEHYLVSVASAYQQRFGAVFVTRPAPPPNLWGHPGWVGRTRP